jgi:hypothetical protein
MSPSKQQIPHIILGEREPELSQGPRLETQETKHTS